MLCKKYYAMQENIIYMLCKKCNVIQEKKNPAMREEFNKSFVIVYANKIFSMPSIKCRN